MKVRYWIMLGLAGAAVIIAASAYYYLSRPGRGDPAPDFTLEDSSGIRISLSDHRGKVCLVHFWATWCDTCKYELPSVEHLHQKFKDRGLVVLSVLEDQDDPSEALAKIREGMPISFPILLDADGYAAQTYMAYGVPESFIIDKDGVILERLTGGIDWDALPFVSYFDRLLK